MILGILQVKYQVPLQYTLTNSTQPLWYQSEQEYIVNIFFFAFSILRFFIVYCFVVKVRPRLLEIKMKF